jgi:hypothetical protein
MTTTNFEKRLAALEKQVRTLTAQRRGEGAPSTNKDWLLNIWGSFADDPAFDEAMSYGRKWRQAQRPATRKPSPNKRGK